jgi:hypothetical protein
MSKSYTNKDYLKIISEYKLKREANPDKHIHYVKNLSGSFTDIITAATIALDDKGEKHIHQYRMSNARLKNFAKKLNVHVDELNEAKNFDEIYRIVSTVRVFGLGSVVYYDTSLRIAHAKNECLPNKIYLTGGALKGAQNLGVNTKGKFFILRSELPLALEKSGLDCHELADLLCCYFAEDKWGDCLEFD